MSQVTQFAPECPFPIQDYPQVLLAHGGGGRLMQQLIEKMFLPAFDTGDLRQQHDSAVFDSPGKRLALTTDSYVVRPLFFPGGDVGKLAIYGTVNDLAMSGARPLWLSAAFIIEEGFPMESLWRVVASMKQAARECGVRIVTGDTKVVDRGKGDGIFINTSGVGVLEHGLAINPGSVKPDDAIIMNGDIGRHGMAIMAVRENLSFESAIETDCAPLAKAALALVKSGIEVHCMRDLTRGGLASALNEIATAARVTPNIDEKLIPIRADVRAACELLGLDPCHVACEGRFVVFVPQASAPRALEIMRSHAHCEGSCQIGSVSDQQPGRVLMKSVIGAHRVLDMLSGEQLPRIC